MFVIGESYYSTFEVYDSYSRKFTSIKSRKKIGLRDFQGTSPGNIIVVFYVPTHT